MINETKWYALRVISGKERKAKEYISKEIEKNDALSKYVYNVVLPMERVYKIRKGKKYSTERNFYPGYLLIEADMNPEALHMIENVPNVMHFLKEGKKPIPLRDDESKRLLVKVDEMNDNKMEFDIPYIIGETVQIIDGPFSSFNGEITHLEEEKKKAKINVRIFGRETSLELNFIQIDKI